MVEIQKIQEEFLEGDHNIAKNVVENAGKFDGKRKKNVSLASHLINVTLMGLNFYAYENFVIDDGEIDFEEIKILTSALVLHDVNKYVNEEYGWDKRKNDEETLKKYFEEDDFGIKGFLEDENLDKFDDLLYLIQRTEVNDRSQDSRGADTDYQHLARYCRLGDAVASKITAEGIHAGKEHLENSYSALDGEHVHLLDFDAIEQPILNNLILSKIKEIIESSEKNVVIGSTIDQVLYLGEELDKESLKNRLNEKLPTEATEVYDFSAKTSWNSFGYDILEDISLPLEEKKKIIADQYAEEVLEDGPNDPDDYVEYEEFEGVNEEFRSYLPTLIKTFYLEGQDQFDNQDFQEHYDEVYGSYDSKSAAGQKIKVEMISYLLKNSERYEEFLGKLKDEKEASLKEDLETEESGISTVVDRFFGEKNLEVAGKSDQCFICGRKADKEYKPGATAFYSTQSFSRRIYPKFEGENYKKICSVCNLENALLSDECDNRGITANDSVEVAYLYFDGFIADVKFYNQPFSDLLEGDDEELDRPEIVRDLTAPQFHLQPFTTQSRSSNKDKRMSKVKNILEKLRDFGMKAVVGKAFTRFDTNENVFYDENPIRIQETLGYDAIENFKELKKPLDFFELLDTIDNHYYKERNSNISNKYLQIQSGNFVELVDFALVNEYQRSKDGVLNQYLENYNGEEFMQMKEVAEKGANLTENYPNSKYKKTKIFREALDALMTGKSQEVDDLEEHVTSQVYTIADREEYVGSTPEKAKAFVEAIFDYLENNDLEDLKKLSDWEDALVNSYYYSFETITQGDN